MTSQGSGYGFGKKPADASKEAGAGQGAGETARLDLSGIERGPVVVDPAREQAALARGAALGFVDRSAGEEAGAETAKRRRRAASPQGSVFIKGPQDTLDWFIDYTNQRGHRSYWQTLEEFRALVEGR
ncbi:MULTISPECIES: hypothetical protein [Bacteria]|uniref:Uncharacterized protein n=2 Tax=Bacteria TaxID=2 RepID=A0A918PQC9_9SPHN|nr:hypothetical protein [Novosphingobium colocasiae]GGZ18130.1 hypothetical protein GCM10011614_35600 [Novosphingobium colocasiae]GLL08828.1 hypothetical protein GCM10017581_106090 [Dactylosporangium matsuzakiense]